VSSAEFNPRDSFQVLCGHPVFVSWAAALTQPCSGRAGFEMTVLRMQPASVAAAALVTGGAAEERSFLKITSQSAPKPVVVERSLSPTPTTAAAIPWVPPPTVNKMCADIGPALSEDAVSELLGTAIEPPDGTATRREPAPSRSMQRQRQEELERINARINQATDAWDDAIRPPGEWDAGDVPQDAEEIQKEIQLLLAGQRKRGSERRDMLEPVADSSHQANQLKQLQQMERESLEEQGESDGGAANVDAAVAVIRTCKERLSALHEKEKELLVIMQTSMGTLGAELLELRGSSAMDAARQLEAEEALKEARALAAALQDQIELRDKASARAAERETELESQLFALKHKADASANMDEMRDRIRALTTDASMAEQRAQAARCNL
jgi:hypothetical protein